MKTGAPIKAVCGLLIILMILAAGGCSSKQDVLGDNLLCGTIELDERVFHLPAPFSEYTEHEWAEGAREGNAYPIDTPSKQDVLGDSLLYGKIELDERVYQLPAPFSEFTEHGWSEGTWEGKASPIDTPDTMIDPKDWDDLYLTKDGAKIKVTVINYSDVQASAKECTVGAVYMEAAEAGGGPELIVPRDIRTGISEKELIAKLQGTGYRYKDSFGTASYVVSSLCSSAWYQFVVEDGTLQSTHVQYALRESEWEREEKLRLAQQKKKPGNDGEVSKDLYSFQIKYGDYLFQVPCTPRDLEMAGWVQVGDSGQIVPGGERVLYFMNLEFGIMECMVTSDSSAEKSYKEDEIRVLRSSTYRSSYPGSRIELPADIFLFESNIDDVIAAYGEPDKREEKDYGTCLTYIAELDPFERSVHLTFSLDSKILEEIDYVNYRN